MRGTGYILISSLVEDRGSTGIPRAQLLDDLFGREELANVGNNLRVTVFRLRKMLIEAGLPEYEYIVKEKGVFYWRSPMKVDLDVARFMELVREDKDSCFLLYRRKTSKSITFHIRVIRLQIGTK